MKTLTKVVASLGLLMALAIAAGGSLIAADSCCDPDSCCNGACHCPCCQK